MKNLKAKLLASVAMLLVSTIMLTSASFAWFTISTAPEISGIETTVVTNETLEIALDNKYDNEAAVDTATTASLSHTGNAYTWGNLIDLSADNSTAKAAYDSIDKTLRPATLDTVNSKLVFKAPTYGNDGRISELGTNLTTKEMTVATGGTAGFGYLIDAGANAASANDDVVYGYYIDYWMRSNVGGNVVLATAMARDGVAADGTDAYGGGSTFTANSTVPENATPAVRDTIEAANEALAANIHVAFQNVTPDATATDATARTAGDIVKAETVVDSADATKSTFKMATNTDGSVKDVITTLTANQAQLIRVYVYLEGAAIKNAHASIDTQDITGALNLQFKIADVNTSMLSTQTTVTQ